MNPRQASAYTGGPLHASIRIPFKGLRSADWKRLGIVALLAFYAVQFGSTVLHHDLFRPMGLDYMGFWSAGRAASRIDYPHAYDVPTLDRIQQQALTDLGVPHPNYSPIPGPLFPVFLLPFQLLSLLDARSGFWLWSLVNIIALVAYLLFYVRELARSVDDWTAPLGPLLLLLLSYPVFQNFYWGQVDVLLLICCGEFIRNALRDRPIAAGLWLGGLLMKPQVLILVLPALFLLKSWRVLAAFIASSLGILLASLALAGLGGLQTMLRLWFSYLPGIATNAPENMVNWRMLGIRLGFISPLLGAIVVVLGMAFSLWIWILLCRKRPPFASPHWVLMMGGLFSISCAFTWHSHIHMMMVVMPFLLFAVISERMPVGIVDIWVFVFPAALLLVLLAAVVISLAALPLNGFGGFVLGLTGLVLNVWIALSFLKYIPAAAPPHAQPS